MPTELAAVDYPIVTFPHHVYIEHREYGEVKTYKVQVEQIWFGPAGSFIMRAIDLATGKIRDFAMDRISDFSYADRSTTLDDHL